jgi:hypothetical protein
MTYGTVNANVIADSNGGVLAPISSVMRNRIINGAMVIDQRTAGASVTPTTTGFFNYQSVDRWANIISQSSKFSMQQNAGSITPPVGFTNYLGVTSLSAYTVLTDDYFQLAQNIEGYNVADLGWGTANAKTVTLSFWVYSSLTGSFGGAIVNNGGARTYPFSYTVSSANTWTQISITVAGDTSGTWLTTNGVGISIRFSLGMGSTYTGTAATWSGNAYYAPTGSVNVVGTNGATFYITGVQLEVGTQATSFEYRQYQQELALCQRYYEICKAAVRARRDSSNILGTLLPFKVTKRAAPTMTQISIGLVVGNVTFNSFQATETEGCGLQLNASDDTAYTYGYTASASSEL